MAHGGNIRFYCEKYNLRPKDIIDFSSNINPVGFPDAVREIINENISSLVHYPDPDCKELIKALAGNLNINPSNICVSNGSIEIIYLLGRVLNPKNILIYVPTFSEYEISAKQANSKITYIKADKKDGFRINIDKIIKHISNVDLIFLCNPNNPTGYLIPKDDIDRLIKKCKENKTYLVMDEVFISFVDDENRNIIKPYLIIIKSFTKFFGIPGIRAGYCIANRQLIEKLNKFKPLWSVNSLALAICEKIIEDKHFIKKTKEFIKAERLFLYNELNNIPFIKPYSSFSNFILCEIKNDLTSTILTDILAKQGILIRNCSNFKGLDNKFFRVSVRKREENIRLIKCLQSFVHTY